MPEKVLIVDDDVPSGTVLKWAMEAMGHDVRLALDGETALDMINSFLPDVVLCDINMLGINGYEVCKAMKVDPRLRDILYIAQTGLVSDISKKRSAKAGFKYHMVKPIDINKLLELVYLEKVKAS